MTPTHSRLSLFSVSSATDLQSGNSWVLTFLFGKLCYLLQSVGSYLVDLYLWYLIRLALLQLQDCSSSASGMQGNRGRLDRNLRPAIRSKLRLRVRHRERVHSEGRWHPLWRSYAEKADLKRTQHIFEAQFGWCKTSFSALLEDSLHHAR